MVLVILLNLILVTMALAEEHVSDITYLVSCHKELDETLPCESAGTIETGNLAEIARVVEADTYLRYKEREKNGEHNEFLAACTERTTKFHSMMGRLALESYDISFLNRKEPNLENQNGGKPPEGYKVSKYYGNNPEECFQTGLKAALFTPDNGDHVVFAITGTEGSEKYSSGKTREEYMSSGSAGFLGLGASKAGPVSAKDKDKEDWVPTPGRKQFASSCAKQMIRDAVALARDQKKKIIFTGHSLGGAVSQAMSHDVQKALIAENIEAPPVEAVTFMSAGGSNLIRNDEKTKNRLRSTVYVSLGDIVSGFGNHIGEIREMVRKDEYEKQFEEAKLGPLDTHTLKLEEFKPLKESINLKGCDINQRMCKYFDHLKECKVNAKAE